MFTNPYFTLMFVVPVFFAGMFTGNLVSLAINPFPGAGTLLVRLLFTGIANTVVAWVLSYVLTRKKDWVFFELRRITCLVLIIVIYVAGAGAGMSASAY